MRFFNLTPLLIEREFGKMYASDSHRQPGPEIILIALRLQCFALNRFNTPIAIVDANQFPSLAGGTYQARLVIIRMCA